MAKGIAMVLYGMVLSSSVWYGQWVRHGKILLGVVWCCKVMYGLDNG